ncbi:unnamed protein product [Caenorhabditis nigoni]
MAAALGTTKFGCIFFVAVVCFTIVIVYAHPDKRQNSDKDDYEDVPDQPFPGKIEIMPIVQRDTKHRGVSETVQEIIRELPNDEQYERIGKMLNNSYDAVSKEMATGQTAIRQKMVMAEDRSDRTNYGIGRSTVISGLFSLMVLLL